MVRASVFGALVAAVLVGPAAASPPPLSVPVTIVGAPQTGSEAVTESRALLDALRADNWFETPSPLAPQVFEPCRAHGVEAEACVRGVLSARVAGQPSPTAFVVVWVEPGAAAARWRCFGVGSSARDAAAQSVELDLDAALSPDKAKRHPLRVAAGRCVIAAAAESGW